MTPDDDDDDEDLPPLRRFVQRVVETDASLDPEERLARAVRRRSRRCGGAPVRHIIWFHRDDRWRLLSESRAEPEGLALTDVDPGRPSSAPSAVQSPQAAGT